MKNLLPAFLLLAALLATGFDFSRHSIPVDEIRGGGPAKDGIPSLTDPKFVQAAEARFLKDKDKVMGIEIEGEARAYPINILNWHEGVNDTIKNSAILVTW
jgi:hypothetical protein